MNASLETIISTIEAVRISGGLERREEIMEFALKIILLGLFKIDINFLPDQAAHYILSAVDHISTRWLLYFGGEINRIDKECMKKAPKFVLRFFPRGLDSI